ncbi:MAG: C40 family peptidase [Lachnospiraceae bacterium]|nr:C40 family peptidase [Lachnospiraceae bacterium]
MRKMALAMSLVFTLLAVLSEPLQVMAGMESTVTPQMCSAAYWNALFGEGASVNLMSAAQIGRYNAAALAAAGCNMNDLTAMDQKFDAADKKEKLAESLLAEMPDKDVYVNGIRIEREVYYAYLAECIRTSGWEGEIKPFYAVAVSQTQIRSIPTLDYVGYSAADTDDEAVLSSLRVNEPFLVKQCAVVNGYLYYWGYSSNVSGWVDAMDIAFCGSRAEWLDMWQVEPEAKDFVVVTGNYFHLSQSYYAPAVSDLLLTMGTTLKLVPEKEIPANIAGRGTWNNHVVYIPVRDENGHCIKQPVLIAQNKDLSIGYLPMTSGNIVAQSFKYLGDTYGWGGMLDSVDCSALVRNVYKCFGLEMPRNTNWQKCVPATCVSLEQMSDEERMAAIAGCIPGTPLYMSGHTMIYLGTVNGVNYVISAMGSAADSTGELVVQTQNTVAVTPLTVRRRNGTTWLDNINACVTPWTTP